MIGGLFKSKKFVAAERNQKILQNEIKKLSIEILRKDGFLKCKNDLFITKETAEKNTYNWGKMEEELKRYQKENIELKKDIEKIENILLLSSIENQYLVKIEKFLPEFRFAEVVKELKACGILYIQSLNENIIKNLIEDEKLSNEVIKRYKNFLNDIMSWNVKTNLMKGERVTRIFKKYRKTVNILTEQSILYMDEITQEVIDKFVNFGYTSKEIKTVNKIFNNYKNKYLIK